MEKRFILLTFGFLLILSSISFFSASILYPHGFEGNVFYSDGGLVKEPLEIWAEMDDIVRDRVVLSNGLYSLVVNGERTGTSRIINFFIEGHTEPIGSHVFEPYFTLTQLDFVIPLQSVPPSGENETQDDTSSSSDSSTSSGSSGGSGGGVSTSISEYERSLNEKTCGEWSDCVNGKQTRLCSYSSSREPSQTESRECFPEFVPQSSSTKSSKETFSGTTEDLPQKFFSSAGGFALSDLENKGPLAIIIGIFVLLLIVLVILLAISKNKKSNIQPGEEQIQDIEKK